jgi:predicted DNA-binding protein with PD1-like motif
MEPVMKVSLLHEDQGQRTFAVVLAPGEEAFSSLSSFAKERKLSAAQISAIGAFSEATLQYFDWETKKYNDIPVREQVEVASLLGDIALSPEGEPALHLHAVLGRRDGQAIAGHLAKATVRPTLEVIVTESPAHLRKKHDAVSGLALIDAV